MPLLSLPLTASLLLAPLMLLLGGFWSIYAVYLGSMKELAPDNVRKVALIIAYNVANLGAVIGIYALWIALLYLVNNLLPQASNAILMYGGLVVIVCIIATPFITKRSVYMWAGNRAFFKHRD